MADPVHAAAPSSVPAPFAAMAAPLVLPLSSAELLARQRSTLVRIVRMAFLVFMLTVTILYVLNTETPRGHETAFGFDLAIGWRIPLTAGLLLSLVVLAIDFLTPRKKIASISGIFFGLIIGLMAAFSLTFVIDLVVNTYEIKAPELVGAIKILLGISLCYLAISAVLQTQDDFRLVIPYVEFAKQIRGPRPLILDSSALIDGRIAEIAGTGVLQIPLVIPRFVVGEMQTLSDSADKTKRLRGRRGLDLVAKLQRAGTLDVTIDETIIPGKAVDQMLIELARIMPGVVVTTDTGLARVAGIQGVSIININDVASALKQPLSVGTQLSIHLLKHGEQPGQAVGYLDDGTMIVVDRAEQRLGSDVQVEVHSALQTSGGRLIFARLIGEQPVMEAGEDDGGDGDDGEDGGAEGSGGSGGSGVAGDQSEEAAGARPVGPGSAKHVTSQGVASQGVSGQAGSGQAGSGQTGAGGQPPAGEPITDPLTVRPPRPQRPGPIGPANKSPRNPFRNPRR